MALTTYAANALLAAELHNTALPWAGAATLYLSLHTADPGAAGNQTTSEANYTGYARIPIARNSSDIDVVNNLAANLAQLAWPECTAGSNTISHIAIGTSASGVGTLLRRFQMPGGTRQVSAGITPIVPVGDLDWSNSTSF